MPPKFALAILTRNRLSFLKEMIISGLNQTFKNFDIIIIDSYSSDGTGLYCNSLKDDRIKYIRINQDLPASNSFKVALEQCKLYDFFSIVHDDDRLETTYIEDGVDLFLKFPDLGLITFNAKYFGNLNFQRKLLYKNIYGTDIIFNQKNLVKFIFKTDTLMFPSLMYKGGLQYSNYLIFEDSSVGDVIFYCNLAKKYKIGVIYKPLYNYRRHISQHSNGIPFRDLKILQRYFNSYSENPVENSNFIFNRYVAYYRSKFNINFYKRIVIFRLLIAKFGLTNLSFINLSRAILFVFRF